MLPSTVGAADGPVVHEGVGGAAGGVVLVAPDHVPGGAVVGGVDSSGVVVAHELHALAEVAGAQLAAPGIVAVDGGDVMGPAPPAPATTAGGGGGGGLPCDLTAAASLMPFCSRLQSLMSERLGLSPTAQLRPRSISSGPTHGK